MAADRGLQDLFLVIAAGGTGGHMFPAQSLAEEMLARGWRVALSTDKRGLGYAGGFPEAVERVALSAASPSRGGILGKLATPFRILAGATQAMRWFMRDTPNAVIGFGGYPSMPALIAAGGGSIPRLIHEQNAVLGRVNRLYADRVAHVACGTWPVQRAPKKAHLLHTGNPVRGAVLEAARPYEAPGDGPRNLLVFGGSQGASVFSELIPETLARLAPELRDRIRLTQQAREAEAAVLSETYAAIGLTAEVAPFFADMPERIAGAQLVIARAGASTVAELAVIGRPAILVPLPGAMDDHQTANAEALAQAGAAILAPQAELTGSILAGHVTAILGDPARASAMAEAARRVAKPEAARELADLVEMTAGIQPGQH